jgi:hypothetical protein
MAIKNKNGLLVSYPCEELIQDISEDIFLFGEDYKVYAVLQFFGTVDGRILDVDFIVDYIDYEMPTEKEFIGDSCELGFPDEADKITLEMLQDDYRKNLKSIENERVVLMTAKELLEKLLLQNSIT